MRYVITVLTLLAHLSIATGADYRGKVRYHNQPIPGATVWLTTARLKLMATTDPKGQYEFIGFDSNGDIVSVTVETPCFVVQTLPATTEATVFELELLPESVPCGPAVALQKPSPAPGRTYIAETIQRPLTGYLINGSVDNANDSDFAQSTAIGNVQRGRSAYFASLLGTLNTSALDAVPYSISGLSPRPPTRTLLGSTARLSGPLSLRRKRPKDPSTFFSLNYEWARNRTATMIAGRVPTLAERNGDFSAGGGAVMDPSSGFPFPAAIIPAQRLSRQAAALTSFYPQAGRTTGAGYNIESPIIRNLHRDAWFLQLTKIIGAGHLAAELRTERVRGDESSLFGFLDRNRSGGEKTTVSWVPGRPVNWQGQFSVSLDRHYERVLPYFAEVRDVAGEAGIVGADARPEDWGPPSLFFSGGMSGLRDVNARRLQVQNLSFAAAENGSIGRWQVRTGFNFSRRQRNQLGVPDARGSFSFTGAASGVDWADFLLGQPATASLATGPADRYLRANDWAVFLMSEWRPTAGLTFNLGARWEYASPYTENYFRLANLAVSEGFASASALPASGANRTLVSPFRSLVQPRVSLAWLPIFGSSLVVRAGYGIYADTGIYELLATSLAAQPPFGRNFAIGNSSGAAPLSLASALTAPGSALGTYGIDSRFRPGTAQNWQASVEGDLGWGLVAKVSYLGVKGTHAQQAIYPNTYPAGGVNPCLSCPSGFQYLLSGGNSSRHAGQMELRRRLRGGWAVRSQITWAKALDNASLGGGNQPALIAQNWASLAAERGRSNFDQRVTGRITADYTFRFTSGWLQRFFDEWRWSSDLTIATGQPITPIDARPTGGTGFLGSLRPDYTGEPLYESPAGLRLNPAAFSRPAAGAWGNAGRNIITGPRQFALNSSLWRTVRIGDRISADLRIDATNPLNHPVFTRWDATLNSILFGLPVAANPMRSIQLGIEVRY